MEKDQEPWLHRQLVAQFQSDGVYSASLTTNGRGCPVEREADREGGERQRQRDRQTPRAQFTSWGGPDGFLTEHTSRRACERRRWSDCTSEFLSWCEHLAAESLLHFGAAFFHPWAPQTQIAICVSHRLGVLCGATLDPPTLEPAGTWSHCPATSCQDPQDPLLAVRSKYRAALVWILHWP